VLAVNSVLIGARVTCSTFFVCTIVTCTAYSLQIAHTIARTLSFSFRGTNAFMRYWTPRFVI